MPVLYLASDLLTCQAELRGVESTVLEFTLTESIHVLDLIDPYEQHRGHDDLLNSLVYSALLSAKQHDEGSFVLTMSCQGSLLIAQGVLGSKRSCTHPPKTPRRISILLCWIQKFN